MFCHVFVSCTDLPEQVSQPQEEAAGAMHSGPTQCQLLRVRQQTRSHSQTQRPQNHGPLPAGQGKYTGNVALPKHKTCLQTCQTIPFLYRRIMI